MRSVWSLGVLSITRRRTHTLPITHVSRSLIHQIHSAIAWFSWGTKQELFWTSAPRNGPRVSTLGLSVRKNRVDSSRGELQQTTAKYAFHVSPAQAGKNVCSMFRRWMLRNTRKRADNLFLALMQHAIPRSSRDAGLSQGFRENFSWFKISHSSA